MIPKIIHHISPEDKSLWHPFWSQCYESWYEQFPNYDFKIWNDQSDLDCLVKDHYPRYWNLYQAFPVHIMRIDFARLCILHKFGGIYADMDMFCYKNFEHYLTKDIMFLENLTHEYTDAQWENSMMSSAPGHRLLEELMKYTQTCFIQFRPQFQKQNSNWRSIENDKIVNNTTGSGMISEASKHFQKYFDIGIFPCELFNNRPVSYDPKFYTKHIHTSVWGSEYAKTDLDRLLILNGCAYLTGNLDHCVLESLNNKDYQIVMNKNFDFHKDYTKGVYLRSDNLGEIRTIVKHKY
jgi:mannosyltransferase OCH1-like enzyme